MRLNPIVMMLAATMAMAIAVHAAPPAPSQAGTKVGVANPSKIFAEMRETKALHETLEAKNKGLTAQANEKQSEIENMIKDRDANYNPKHPKYMEISEQIDTAKAQFQAWGTATKASGEREQKMMVRTLYDKIEAAVGQVAQQNGLDLVISDGRQEITNLDAIPSDELRRILAERVVLYATKPIDITDTVIAVLDQQYAKGQIAGGGPAVGPAVGPRPGPGVGTGAPAPIH